MLRPSGKSSAAKRKMQSKHHDAWPSHLCGKFFLSTNTARHLPRIFFISSTAAAF
jgi:hypothetical protein